MPVMRSREAVGSQGGGVREGCEGGNGSGRGVERGGAEGVDEAVWDYGCLGGGGGGGGVLGLGLDWGLRGRGGWGWGDAGEGIADQRFACKTQRKGREKDVRARDCNSGRA